MTIFSTIEDRSSSSEKPSSKVMRVLRDYRPPRIDDVDWPAFIERLQNTIEFHVPEPIPKIQCRVDEAQIEQVLINLVKNAHESGSPADKITFTVTERPNSYIFAITDEGGGINEEILQNALLPFYSTKKSGTGLGLPLCREIVEAHGGRLSLLNAADKGLHVSILLPATGST